MELSDMVEATDELTGDELAGLLRAIASRCTRTAAEQVAITEAALDMVWDFGRDRIVKDRVMRDEWVTVEDFRDALVEEIERDGGVVIYGTSSSRHDWPELDRLGVEVITSGAPETWRPQDWGTVWIKVYQSDVERLAERAA